MLLILISIPVLILLYILSYFIPVSKDDKTIKENLQNLQNPKNSKNPKKLSTQLIELENSDSFNVSDDLKRFDNEILKKYSKGIGYSILVCNLSGSFNMGLIIRSASLSGCSNLFYIGKKHYDKRTTVGAHNYLTVQHLDGICEPLQDIKDKPVYNFDKFKQFIIEHRYFPVFIEQGGQNYTNVKWIKDKNILFIAGNERYGIPKELMAAYTGKENSLTVSIPQYGVLRSHNVACAISIVSSYYYNSVMKTFTPGE